MKSENAKWGRVGGALEDGQKGELQRPLSQKEGPNRGEIKKAGGFEKQGKFVLC